MSPSPRRAVSDATRTTRRAVRRAAAAPGARAAAPAARRAAHETLVEAHALRQLRHLADERVFDVEYYAAQAGRSFGGVREAAWHYLHEGRWADLSPHPLYEPRRHLRDDRYRRRLRIAPYALFLERAHLPRTGAHELFDASVWAERHPESLEHPRGPWGHYVATAGDDEPLPLPEHLGRLFRVTRGQWRAVALTHAARWREQEDLRLPPRVEASFDASAQQRLRTWAAAQPRPSTGDDEPLVSVVMPVRNRPGQVLEAIASVQAQTATDWELLVVDDGSSDHTPDVVAEVAGADPRVRLLRREPSGVSAARNSALEAARGRYVAFLDSDNTWHDDVLDVVTRTMAARGLRAAFTACEMVAATGTTYRTFAGGLQHLALHNFVDLNVLVLERSLLAEVGFFDTALVRAVDYDLVVRVARATDLAYLPLLGTVYRNDDQADRISVRELNSWNYVVRDRHAVPWQRLEREVAGRPAGRVSVVVPSRGQWSGAWDTVRTVLETTPGDDVEVVVVESGTIRPAYLLSAAAETLSPRVRLVRTPANYNVGPSCNVGLAQTTGETVVMVPAGVTVRPGWLEPLRRALADPAVCAAGPVVETADGLVASVGAVLPADLVLPVPLLRDLPPEYGDALLGRLAGDQLAVPALTRSVLAVRAADLVAAHGFDPLFVDAFDDADLCLRLAERTGGRCVVAVDSRASQPWTLMVNAAERSADNQALFRSRWADRADDRADLWQLAGLDLQGYRVEEVPTARPVPQNPRRPLPATPLPTAPVVRPVITRPGAGEAGLGQWVVELPEARDHDAEEPNPLIDAADALVAALRGLGMHVVTRRTAARYRAVADLDDVVLVLVSHAHHLPAPVQPGCVNLVLALAERDGRVTTVDGATLPLMLTGRLDPPGDPRTGRVEELLARAGVALRPVSVPRSPQPNDDGDSDDSQGDDDALPAGEHRRWAPRRGLRRAARLVRAGVGAMSTRR